ncbi:uncharacterized protein PG986_008930 [Apiospora aurea]|uniref:C2H2-type domain-containing protein n=1 Tax=Apiospora aurea TaxID=335848 RepID=A0ABR1Q6L6_9PEZI
MAENDVNIDPITLEALGMTREKFLDNFNRNLASRGLLAIPRHVEPTHINPAEIDRYASPPRTEAQRGPSPTHPEDWWLVKHIPPVYTLPPRLVDLLPGSYLPRMMVSGPPQPLLSSVIEHLATRSQETLEHRPPLSVHRPRYEARARPTHTLPRRRPPPAEMEIRIGEISSDSSQDGGDSSDENSGNGGDIGDRSRVATGCGRARFVTNPRPEGDNDTDTDTDSDEERRSTNNNPRVLEQMIPEPFLRGFQTVTLCLDCGAEELRFCRSVPWGAQIQDGVQDKMIARGRLVIREITNCYRCLRWLVDCAVHATGDRHHSREEHGWKNVPGEHAGPRGIPGGRDGVAAEQNTGDQQAEDRDTRDLDTGDPDDGDQVADGHGIELQSPDENVPAVPVSEDVQQDVPEDLQEDVEVDVQFDQWLDLPSSGSD